jgi:acyl-CoA dehydrogenase
MVVPAGAPGITISPIADIGEGHHSLNEVFFDNVVVPSDHLIGEQDKGWNYAKFLLDNERAFSAEVPRNRKNYERLRKIASIEHRAGRPVIDDEAFALRLAQAQVDLDSLEYLTLSALYERESKNKKRPISSVLKIRGSEFIQRTGELAMEALGDRAALFYAEPERDDDIIADLDHAYGVSSEFFYRRAVTIYGGSNEIQRNLIARYLLGGF